MKRYEGIFRANDIRGVYGADLDEAIARRIGRALAVRAAAAGARRLAVGRDGRLSSPALAEALIEGIVRGGMDVVAVGLVPTPALYYAAVTRCGGCGVMVTGSHNPKEYNGLKMMLGGRVLMGEAMVALRTAALGEGAGDSAGDAAGGGGRRGGVEAVDVRAEFVAAVAAANPLARPLHVVLDAGNGAAGEVAPALFEALGCRVEALFCEVDGNFPNHHPDPAQPDNLRDARAALARTGAEVAFAFDGDGDRLGVLTAAGEVVFADRLLMVFARDLLARRAGARVVFDVKCSAHLGPWVARYGGVPDMQPTGHAFIKARMADVGAPLGGEMSGHFYFGEGWYGFDDALFAAARLAVVAAREARWLDGVPDSVCSPELQVAMAGRDAHAFVAELAREAGRVFADARDVVTLDGVRVEFDGGFGLVRASNTTPALVLRFEALDEAGLGELKARFRRWLLAADGGLVLPF